MRLVLGFKTALTGQMISKRRSSQFRAPTRKVRITPIIKLLQVMVVNGRQALMKNSKTLRGLSLNVRAMTKSLLKNHRAIRKIYKMTRRLTETSLSRRSN